MHPTRLGPWRFALLLALGPTAAAQTGSYVPSGPPIANGQPKFLGGVSSPAQNPNFAAYFNQVTPENGGKWGSVEAVRDVMNWGQLDVAYALATANGIPFRLHTLVWGNQQPAWIESLPPAEQRAEIEEWLLELAARYPRIDFIDVVNEPLNDPPGGAGNGNYAAALGGAGATGYDWIMETFRLARLYFPESQLGINEYSVTNNATNRMRYLQIITLLRARGLIDTVGIQGHAFSTRGQSAAQIRQALDELAAPGLPLYITELDIDGPSDDIQLTDYQRIFPAFWEHPAVRGITLWGYRPGHWRSAQGAYLALADGSERPALRWLIGYVAATPLTRVTLQGLEQFYDGTPRTVTGASLAPAGLAITVSYDGASTAPTLPGRYAVTGRIAVPPHATTASGTLHIRTAFVSRHAPVIGGTVADSLQVLLPDSVTLDAGARVLGDLLVPGLPTLRSRSTAQAHGTLDGTGAATPDGHEILLHDGATLRHLVRRIDAASLDAVAAPFAPAGARDVAFKQRHWALLDFFQVRNLTLHDGAESLHVPPGSYGTLAAHGPARFILGRAGATAPARYDLQSLSLRGGARLQVLGPVVLRLAAGAVIDGEAGDAAHTGWLRLEVASGDVRVASAATLHAHVLAPSSTVVLDGGLVGTLAADRIVVNAGGRIGRTP